MAKILKKALAVTASAAIAASVITVPVIANAEGKLKTWKFDFGSVEDVADGYIAVTPDVNYTLNTSGDEQYGFIGTNSKDYKLNGGHIDGFVQQEGQVIELSAGGGTGLYDGIGSTGEDQYHNAGDKYYPVRFALKVKENGYYKVKATVTTLDPAKDATASLYTERKHPLYTEKTIQAGDSVTTEFTVRPTAIYYKGPATSYSDDMVNVCVLGENTALAALEIEELETAPVLWVLGDSTVTDGGGSLPFFPLQNYTGVGTGLTKYLPSNIAMVNEGEGGLDAHDNQHYNMVAKNIKAGDFMYVEYGHNHKSDGVSGYLSAISKYYKKCKEVGATLILVGPIDRHNDSQYDSANNEWSSTLGGYSKAAKAYVDLMLWGGESAASTFVSKYSANDSETVAAAYEYADGILEGDKSSDITNVAFVDLNQPSLDWLTTITAGGKVAGEEYTNNIRLADYYFRGTKNTSHGNVDGTHPNDAGAENLAYFFYSTADTEAYPALEPLMTRYKAGEAEDPTPVSQSILDLGWAGNAAWPEYVTVSYDYPLVIKKIVTDEDGNITGMDVYKQDSMDTYASGVVVINDTQYVTSEHIDNTWDNKNTYTINFANPIPVAEGVTYEAYMWSCSLDEERLLTEEEGGKKLSANYVPAEYDAYLLPGDEGDIETFDYYGKEDLIATGKYTFKGSTGSNFSLGEDDGRTYANIVSTGGGSSYWLYRQLENVSSGTGTNGKYIIEADIKYNSGYNGNALEVAFAPSITNNSPYVNNPYELFTIGGGGALYVKGTSVGSLTALNWTNVRYILDMSAGTASVSINGGDPVVVTRSEYATFETPSIGSMNYFVFTTATRSATFDVQFSNLTVAKLADGGNATINIAVDGESTDMGKVYIGEEGTTTQTVSTASEVTATAEAAEGYAFVGWFEGDTLFSDEAELNIARLYRDINLTAKFRTQTLPAKVTVNYIDEAGNAIKTPTTITDVDGKAIYAETAFALSDASYTAAVKKQLANGMYDVYLYNSEKSDPLTIDSLATENTINIVFTKMDDVYYDYEDFEDTSVGKWDFSEGRSGNVFISNGALTLYNGSGTTASQQTSDVKNFDEAIKAAKKINVSFDWKNTAANGRHSYFNLYDSSENIIFSLQGGGSVNKYGVGVRADTDVSGAAGNWHSVELAIDFEASTLSGTITDLTTGAITTVAETNITASELASMKTVYSYSNAPQAIDNVGISRARTEEDVVSEPTKYTVTFTGANALAKIDSETVTEYTAEENSTVSFTVEAEEGYKVSTVSVNDTELTATDGVYTIVLTADVEVVITTEEEKKEPIIITGFDSIAVENDAAAVDAAITNNQDEAMTVQIIVAEYNTDGALVRLALDEAEVAAGSTENVSTSVSTVDNDFATIKAFLWNVSANNIPLAEVLISSAE